MLFKKRYLLLFGLLFCWILFLFLDKFIQGDSVASITDNSDVIDNSLDEDLVYSDFSGSVLENQVSETESPENLIIDKVSNNELAVFAGNLDSSSVFEKGVENEQTLSIDGFLDLDSNKDIASLQLLYESSEDSQVLLLLIQRLVEEYEFTNAWYYLKDFDIEENKIIDVSLYTYIRFNVLSVLDDGDLQDFELMINSFSEKSLLTSDEVLFYRFLIDIWRNDYSLLGTTGLNFASPEYIEIIDEINIKLENLSQQEDIPLYYQDCLIALVFMKNGYFSVAKKIALYTILQNDSYVLPYQILAYTHFLTKNWHISSEYFLKLIELDTSQQSIYKFFVGIANYRVSNNKTSILYLTQTKDQLSFASDVYRYLILNYEVLKNYSNLASSRNYLLDQDDLTVMDLYHLYYFTFFDPYRNGESFDFYQSNIALIDKSLDLCDDLGNNNICLYGKVGLDIAKGSWDLAETRLLYLSKEFPQSYIFKALGDFYFYQKDDENKAKFYYLQALGLSDLAEEQKVIKNLLLKEF